MFPPQNRPATPAPLDEPRFRPPPQFGGGNTASSIDSNVPQEALVSAANELFLDLDAREAADGQS
jgi:hypothetical protein